MQNSYRPDCDIFIIMPHWKFPYKVPIDLKSKKISNDQELIQLDPTSYSQNQREITKYINGQQFTKGTRGKRNEQLFPKQVVIRLPKIYKICR